MEVEVPPELPLPEVGAGSVPSGLRIVIAAAVSEMLGGALAWMVVYPAATPVTGTLTLVVFGANVTVEGTVATPVLSDVKFTVKPPAGAGVASCSVKVPVFCPVIVKVSGTKVAPMKTIVGKLATAKFGAEAITATLPRLMPVI